MYDIKSLPAWVTFGKIIINKLKQEKLICHLRSVRNAKLV